MLSRRGRGSASLKRRVAVRDEKPPDLTYKIQMLRDAAVAAREEAAYTAGAVAAAHLAMADALEEVATELPPLLGLPRDEVEIAYPIFGIARAYLQRPLR